MKVAGHNAVIVGGASGMALATATMFVEKGGRVAILDLPDSNGAHVASNLGGTFHPCDVRDFIGTEAALNAAFNALGPVHLLVNTAGRGISERTISKSAPHPLEDFQQIVDLNLVATFNVSRLVAFHMAKNAANDDGERGVIINTASIAAFEGQIGQVAYAASKGGVVAMTLAMARDLGGLGIRALALAPSLFATGLTEDIPGTMTESMAIASAFPRRMGQPMEYARMAIALYETAMMNGETVRIDAGQRLGPR